MYHSSGFVLGHGTSCREQRPSLAEEAASLPTPPRKTRDLAGHGHTRDVESPVRFYSGREEGSEAGVVVVLLRNEVRPLLCTSGTQLSISTPTPDSGYGGPGGGVHAGRRDKLES